LRAASALINDPLTLAASSRRAIVRRRARHARGRPRADDHPQLILMDEPSEGLAPVMVQHLEEIVIGLNREGLSILLVEQNLYSALAVADRVYILETGQVVHQGDAAALALETDLLFQRLGVQ